MRRSLFLYSCFVAASVASAAAQSLPSGPAPAGLDAIAAYAGRWQTDIQYLDTPYSKKSESKYGLRNECWRSAGYYACDQFVDGESKALVVFTYDPAKGYASYPIPASGGDVHPGRLIIEGKVWTFPWQVTQDGKTTYFHVINTWDSPDSIGFRQEYSADGKLWIPMAQGHETRVTD